MVFGSGWFWAVFILVGFAGLGIGMGLVLGTFVAKHLRAYMRDEGIGPKDKD